MGQSHCNGQWSHWLLVDSCLLSSCSIPPSISLNHPLPSAAPQNSYSLHYKLYIIHHIFLSFIWKSIAIPPTPIPITFCWEGMAETSKTFTFQELPTAPAPDISNPSHLYFQIFDQTSSSCQFLNSSIHWIRSVLIFSCEAAFNLFPLTPYPRCGQHMTRLYI